MALTARHAQKVLKPHHGEEVTPYASDWVVHQLSRWHLHYDYFSIAIFGSDAVIAWSEGRPPTQPFWVTHYLSGWAPRFLRSGAAFHSHHMRVASTNLKTALEDSGSKFEYQRTRVPLFSTVTGTCVSGRKLDPKYWEENLQKPVQFWEAVTTAMNTCIASHNKGDTQNVRLMQ